CPFDGTDLVAVQTKPGTPVVDTLDTSTTHMGCPTCQKAFELGSCYCPFDGDELMLSTSDNGPLRPDRTMVCPECNGEFDGDAAFCSHDHTRLVASDSSAVPEGDDERYLSLVPM